MKVDGHTPVVYRSIVAIGRRIRAARHAAGVSLSVVAAKAGCSVMSVSEIERGLANPTIDLLQRVADAAGVEIAIVKRKNRKG